MLANYSLKTPVTHNGVTYKELTFRRPKTGDMMVLDKFDGDMSKMVALIAAISDVPIQAIKEADFADFTAISEVVAPLLGESQPQAETGQK